MRNKRLAGTTLIEILVVIVVFLVGILAIVQVFPGGLNILRISRSNTIAINIARAEIDRLKGRADVLAEQIVPVQYLYGSGGVAIQVDANRRPGDLLPAGEAIRADGVVISGGNPIDYWPKVSGANLFSRVIGEGNKVPGPRFVAGSNTGFYGGLMSLQFAPIYWNPTDDTILQVYGNDFVRRQGNRQNDNPDPYGRTRENQFTYVADEDTESTDPFANQDQIWIAPTLLRKYRIEFSFAMRDSGNNDRQYDIVTTINLTDSNQQYAQQFGKYWVISLPKLAFASGGYAENEFKGAIYDTIRIQRIYDRLDYNVDFSVSDPYQFKVLSQQLGFLLINPLAFNYRIQKPNGRETLTARADYTVFDWRLIRDEFRVPADMPFQQKLVLSSVRVKGIDGPDGLAYGGIGLQLPVGGNSLDSRDFAVLDEESGGVFLPADYTVDKSNGLLTFADYDNDISNGLTALISYPSGDPNNPWQPPVTVNDIRGRSVRAMYMGNGEWSPQVLKAASQYGVTVIGNQNELSYGKCFVGGSNPNNIGLGVSRRIYFPWSEINKKVVIGEIWYSYADPVSAQTLLGDLQDQEFKISAPDSLDQATGMDRPRIDFYSEKLQAQFELLNPNYDPNSIYFDYSNGYAVRRVRGASISVRVLWNPTFFKLTNDATGNMDKLKTWMQSWRRTETETFLTGGQ